MEYTINQIFKNRARQYNDRVAVEKKYKGQWISATWEQYYERARSLGLGLLSIGIQAGNRVGLLSENRLEWLYTDMGTLGIGACLVPIYPTLPAVEVSYIVNNCSARVLVVEDAIQLTKALEIKKNCDRLKHIILIEPVEIEVPAGILFFNQLLEKGRTIYADDDQRFESLADAVQPEDTATIVYTSGTTDMPKGAVITHKNIMTVIRALEAIEPCFAFETDQTVPFLPLSHVFERAAGHFYGMYVGLTTSYAESIDTFKNDVLEKKPTVILAVPGMLEEIYHSFLNQIEDQTTWMKLVFKWGHQIGIRISTLREAKKTIPLFLNLQFQIAHQIIFKKLHDSLGGRVRWMAASGASVDREIILFFNAVGIHIHEAYGMTECFGPVALSKLDSFRIGTVGVPIPGVDIKIASDGEILIKGANVFKNYWGMPTATKEAFTVDGYLMSGDIGDFDEQGFLSITDRKKNIIITSNGKNVAPQKIESLFMGDSLFNHIIVVGDQRKYLTALINIDLEDALELARKHNLDYNYPEDLLDLKKFKDLVFERVQIQNKKLACFETIREIAFMEDELTQEEGELTPSFKIKRNIIQGKYSYLIEQMYK